MISREEKNKLKKIIGPRHILQISKYLNRSEIYNKDDQEYSGDFISKVFNGRVENRKIEGHIWDFAGIRKREDAEEERRRQRLLEEYKNE